MITNASSLERNLIYIDLYTIIGDYDSVLQIMNREIFIKTDSGFHFKGGYYFKSPKYYIDYVTAYIAKRDFENALKLLTNNTTVEKNPNSKEAKKKFLMKIFPMYQEGESDNMSDNMSERFNRYKEEYSYFNFYSSLLNDLTNKNYEMALLQLNNFYKTREPSFYKLDGREVKYLNGDIFQFEFIIFSLKGYILSKLNKKDEAKLAYQQALKSNPECREALDELKALN
jgi:tetratricopeptide (TPR) repeat protein